MLIHRHAFHPVTIIERTERSPMHQEFLEAAEAYAKKARRVAVGLTVECENQSYGTHRWVGHVGTQLPFLPRWFLIEPVEGMLIHDVRYGQLSQFSSPVPTALYSMDEALSLLDAPDSPAWDRFKLEPSDGRPLEVGNRITVLLEETGERKIEKTAIQCVFIGDEPTFRPWKGVLHGIIRAVSMTSEGPIVEVATSTSTVTIPIMPSDIPKLTEKLGRHVTFKLCTED
jgi:hypothetical protein